MHCGKKNQYLYCVYIHIWRFPEIWIPLSHPIEYDFPEKTSSYWGTNIYGNPDIYIDFCMFVTYLCHQELD